MSRTITLPALAAPIVVVTATLPATSDAAPAIVRVLPQLNPYLEIRGDERK